MKSEYELIMKNCLILIIFVRNIIVCGTVLKFYYSDGNKKAWHEAREYCESRGMELAMLDTEEKYDAAIDYINGYKKRRSVWIGLKQYKSSRNHQYVHRYLNGLEPAFLLWHSGKPEHKHEPLCVRMHEDEQFKFCTKSCSDSNNFLCTSLLEKQTTQKMETTTNMECNSSFQQTDSTTTAEYDTTTNPKDGTTVMESHSTATTTEDFTGSTKPNYSTPATTNDGTTPEQSQHGDLLDCLCSCSNYTSKWLYNLAELKRIMQPDLDKMTDMLKIDYKKTSRYRRSVTSADDSRNSSFITGMVGVAVISSIVCFFILIDSNVVAKSNNKRRGNVVGVNEM